jgi:coenzyme F420-reducing hydrogenase delta subunit
MRLVIFACQRAAQPEEAVDEVEVALLRLPCAGRVDSRLLLRSLREGADNVLVVGCLEGNCHHESGCFEARKRVDQVRAILKQMGMDAERVRMLNIASNEGWRLTDELERYKEGGK